MVQPESSSRQQANLLVDNMKYSSFKDLKQQKEAMKESVLKRIGSMGLKTPLPWKDEQYRNELRKLDELYKNKTTSSDFKQRKEVTRESVHCSAAKNL